MSSRKWAPTVRPVRARIRVSLARYEHARAIASVTRNMNFPGVIRTSVFQAKRRRYFYEETTQQCNVHNGTCDVYEITFYRVPGRFLLQPWRSPFVRQDWRKLKLSTCSLTRLLVTRGHFRRYGKRREINWASFTPSKKSWRSQKISRLKSASENVWHFNQPLNR